MNLSFVLILQLASTLFMVGLIWFVQVVHYPLFDGVGQNAFQAYALNHNRLTSWVVMPPMFIELATSMALVWFRPAGVRLRQVIIGLVLLTVIWLSTFLVQVPQHTVLLRGYDADAHQVLVATNWIRTIAWSCRGLLVFWMMTRFIKTLRPPAY